MVSTMVDLIALIAIGFSVYLKYFHGKGGSHELTQRSSKESSTKGPEMRTFATELGHGLDTQTPEETSVKLTNEPEA